VRKVGKYAFMDKRRRNLVLSFSAIKASKLLCQGYEGYWCYVMDIQEKEETVSNVPIVCEFKDAFLKELPGLPPQRKIDFEIKFIPGFQPISKAPYRMAPTEFKELKIQLVDLLQKGFI